MLCKSRHHWLLAAALAFAGGAAAAPPAAETARQDGAASQARTEARRALLAEQVRLEEKLAATLEDSADAARAFGQLLAAGARRELQGSCSALARNPDNIRARERLQAFVDRHRNQGRRVVARYCFGPSLRQLLQEVRATRRVLQQRPDPKAVGQFDFRFQRLEGVARAEQRRFAAISRMMDGGP